MSRSSPRDPTIPMLKRARALRQANLSWEAVRAVLELDYGRGVPCRQTFVKYLSEGELAGHLTGGHGLATPGAAANGRDNLLRGGGRTA